MLPQHVRLAVRGFLREPGVTLVALGSLAIGIAANATIFSLVQAVEFPRLVYPQASRIVFLESRNDTRRIEEMPVSAPDALDIAIASHTLELASLTADQSSIVRDTGLGRRISGRRVNATFFDVLRVPASQGRVLSAQDDHSTVVLSDRIWRTAFGSDARLVGRSLHIDGTLATVIGIMPPRFDLDVDFWVPLLPVQSAFARDDRQFTMFARLASGASIDDASRELADISARLAAAEPATNANWVMYPIQLTRLHGSDSRGAFVLLQGAVGVVLLIACANIANILLARGTKRTHEMALRLSLGASRRRLLAQLLSESVILALAGGAVGVLLAMWGIRLARAIGGFPDIIDPQLNLLVLGFTAGLSMLTGIVCGIIPALRASGVAPEIVLRAEGGRGSTGSSRGRIRAGLVALQIASAVVLATCGALMIQTLLHRQRVDLGFDPARAVRADVSLDVQRQPDAAAMNAAVASMLDRIDQAPAVAAAGVSVWALPAGTGTQRAFTLPADQDRELDAGVRRTVEAVTPQYFEALGVSVTRGRAFTAGDRAGTAQVAIVNAALAARLWPGRNPLGAPLRLGTPGNEAPVVTVIGVVNTIRRSAMHDAVIARAYVPYAQFPGRNITLVVRGRREASSLVRELPALVQQADPALLVEELRTMDDDVAQFVAPVRLVTMLLAGFALTGLLLAALGVFGTMSYSVSQREREMAVRSALGANSHDLVRLVLRSGLRITAAGLLPGVLAAVVAARALGSFLYGVDPADPVTLAVVASGLALVSLAACYRPARSAASGDPMTILRQP